jgi:cytochrome c556
MDNFLNSKKFIFLLAVMLLCAGLSGCAKPKPKVDENKLGAIGNMLGCMFNPSLCEKGKTPADDEEEWNDISEETK